jgi:hypothetical protein
MHVIASGSGSVTTPPRAQKKRVESAGRGHGRFFRRMLKIEKRKDAHA